MFVPVVNCCFQRLASGQLLSDSLVNQYVRIHGHTNGQHNTGHTGQGQNSANGVQNTEDEEHVHHQRQIGRPACAGVVEQHVQEHNAHGVSKRPQAGLDRLFAQAWTYHVGLNDAGRYGQFTGAKNIRQVSRFLQSKTAFNLGTSTGDLAHHTGVAVHQAVQNHGNVALRCFGRFFSGNAFPQLSSLAVHGHAHDGVVSVVKFLAGVDNDFAVEFGLVVAVATQGNQHGDIGFFFGTGPSKTDIPLITGNHRQNSFVTQITVDFGRVFRCGISNDWTFANGSCLGIYVEGHGLQQGTKIFVCCIGSCCLWLACGVCAFGRLSSFGIRNRGYIQSARNCFRCLGCGTAFFNNRLQLVVGIYHKLHPVGTLVRAPKFQARGSLQQALNACRVLYAGKFNQNSA